MYAIRSYYDYLKRMKSAKESEMYYSPSLEVENKNNKNGLSISAIDGKEWYIRITSYNVCYTKLLRLRSVYSPGHTTDSISLLDEDMNLFCGDAASDFLRILGTSYTPPFITDLSQFYVTWQKIIDSGVKKLYPAHGNPFDISKIKKNINRLSPDKTGEFVWD